MGKQNVRVLSVEKGTIIAHIYKGEGEKGG